MSFAPAKKTRVVTRLFFVLAFIPMVCVFPYLPAVNNPNENVRTYMTMAMVDEHTFCVDTIVQRFGWVNDMARVPAKDGSSHYYSVKAPAMSYAAAPFYWAFRKLAPHFGHSVPTNFSSPLDRAWWMRAVTWVERIFTVQIPCFVFLVLFERYLRGVTGDPVLRLSAVAAACLGSNYLAYTNLYASHSLYAVSTFGAFALSEYEQRRSHPTRRRASMAFAVGFLAGWSVLLEYFALPVAVVLALYGAVVFRRPTRLLALMAGGLLHVGAMMYFQWRAFGNPLTPGHKMVESAAFAAEHAQGIFGIVWPTWENIRNLSVHPGYGFFGTSPFMWLGLLAIPAVLAHAPLSLRVHSYARWSTLVWVLAMATMLLVNAGFLHWRAGWSVGPRYLVAGPPFFALGAAFALDKFAGWSKWRRAVARGVAAGLTLASVAAIGLVGIVYNSLPETVSRPLMQFALPLSRTGFVPHHVLEWIGVTGAWPWYLAAGGLFGAALLAAFLPAGDSWRTYPARGAVLALATAVGLQPALSKPLPEESGTGLGWWAAIWEPVGRDRITLTREDAERYGPRRPCTWYRLGALERTLDMTAEAARDEERATGGDRERCLRAWF